MSLLLLLLLEPNAESTENDDLKDEKDDPRGITRILVLQGVLVDVSVGACVTEVADGVGELIQGGFDGSKVLLERIKRGAGVRVFGLL